MKIPVCRAMGNNDMEFVNIAEFVCDDDYFCEWLAENVHVCVSVHETCVRVCVCAVDVWLRIARESTYSLRVGS